MLEKIIRSPFVMMIMLIFLGLIYIGIQEGIAEYVFYPFLLFFIGYFVVLYFHNRRHPDRKIKMWTVIPYELREEDEGLQYFTFKAMRKVYIFYYFAIPFGIVSAAFLSELVPYFTIWLLILFGITQYFIYWLEIRKALIEEE